MKRLIALLLSMLMLTMVFVLASCGNETPTAAPTEKPTEAPTAEPTAEPTTAPNEAQTAEPTAAPTEAPGPADPTAAPTEAPTAEPTAAPTEAPTEEPTAAPTEEPTAAPTEEPTSEPTQGGEPIVVPTTDPDEWGDGWTKPKGYEDVGFGGFTVRFITTKDTADEGDTHPLRWQTDHEVAVDSRIKTDTGFATDPAVYDRNSVMKELYDVNIVVAHIGDNGDLIKNDITSGTNEYDFSISQYGIYGGNTNGYYVNAYDLDLNFDLPGWNKTYIEEVTVKDSNGKNKLYLLDGDFNLSAYRATWVMMCNIDMWERNFEDSIFDIVNSGEWTVDELMARASKVKQDNGDSKWVVGDDTFGLLYYTYFSQGLVMSLGLQFVKNENGVLTCTKDIITANNAADRVVKGAELYQTEGIKGDSYTTVADEMRAGRTLFISEVFDVIERLSDTTTLNVAPIPLPLYEASENCDYRFYVNTKASYLSVSANAFGSNKKLMADFLNMYTFHSNKIVLPAFLKAYGQLYCQDQHAIEMVQYIINNRHYDYGNYNTTINGYGEVVAMFVDGTPGLFTTKAAKMAANGKKTISTLVETMTKSQ